MEPEVAKEPEVAPSISTGGAEPGTSKAPVVEPVPSTSGSLAIELSTQAPKSPVGCAGDSLLASSSVVRQDASNPVDQNLEIAFDRMREVFNAQQQSVRSLVQVTLWILFPYCLAPKYSVDVTVVKSTGYLTLSKIASIF